MNHILREIKLSNLTDTPMSEEATKLVEFWDELWTDMKVKVDPSKGEIRCWKDDYKYYYFRQDDRNDCLWCDTEKIWSFFRLELGLNYSDTQELVHQMVGETLNCKVNTPPAPDAIPSSLVGETLNYKVNIPISLVGYRKGSSVSKTLNCVANTPKSRRFI